MPRAFLFSARERTLTGEPEIVGTYLVALDMSSDEDDSSSRCPSLMSSGASQSCGLSRHISFCPLSIHNNVLFESRFLDDRSLNELCQIVFAHLPKCASKGEQFSDFCVSVLRHFLIFSNAVSK